MDKRRDTWPMTPLDNNALFRWQRMIRGTLLQLVVARSGCFGKDVTLKDGTLTRIVSLISFELMQDHDEGFRIWSLTLLAVRFVVGLQPKETRDECD